jgi:hypothetical protein
MIITYYFLKFEERVMTREDTVFRSSYDIGFGVSGAGEMLTAGWITVSVWLFIRRGQMGKSPRENYHTLVQDGRQGSG